MPLDHYRMLGRSGLRISPLALGTMTFGEVWGAEEAESARIFDHYVDLGGNLIDTAGYYAHGRSEELTGRFAASKRHRLVLSTKYSLAVEPGDPNAAGNGRKTMIRSVEDSLKRLKTDYIDLLFLHVWDGLVQPDEILRGFDDLVRQGKILYIGISDTPAWQVSRMQMMAELRGWTRFVAMQAEYNLVDRSAERDVLPCSQELGIGVLPWSALANGLLSGKYATGAAVADEPPGGRRAALEMRGRINPRAIAIADATARVAKRLGVTSAQVALAWTRSNPAVVAPLIGARTLAQLQDNLGALDVVLDEEALTELAEISAFDLGFPHQFLAQDFVRAGLAGGTVVERR